MTRRQRLSATQIAELFDPPTEQRELIRHYTLSPSDLAAIGRRRGDHNRLGHALMRCYLRYPGRPLRVGGIFRKAEGRQARAFQADARAINEKVRLYARVGAALINAQTDKQDAFSAIATVIPWERFCRTVAEAQALARPEEFDAFEKLGEHYSAIRRWSPAFLSAFAFESVPASASLMRAIEVLREMNRTHSALLPKSVPTGFVRQRWAAYV